MGPEEEEEVGGKLNYWRVEMAFFSYVKRGCSAAYLSFLLCFWGDHH